jgi:hypothetical protein
MSLYAEGLGAETNYLAVVLRLQWLSVTYHLRWCGCAACAGFSFNIQDAVKTETKSPCNSTVRLETKQTGQGNRSELKG